MLKGLPSSFDRIVLDSPPVMGFTDASLIAHEQAGVVFVVSADRTGRRAAQAALERLEAVGARFVGAVLNRVAPEAINTVSYFDDDEDEDSYVEYATVPVQAAAVIDAARSEMKS
jgi:Mrp family chromosome partitioning ATPase